MPATKRVNKSKRKIATYQVHDGEEEIIDTRKDYDDICCECSQYHRNKFRVIDKYHIGCKTWVKPRITDKLRKQHKVKAK